MRTWVHANRALDERGITVRRDAVVAAFFRESFGFTWRAIYELPTTEDDICKAQDDGIYLHYVIDGVQVEGGEEATPKAENKEML